MKKISVYITTFFVCATVLGLNLAHAQTQVTNDKHKSRNEQTADEFRFDSLLAQARPMRRAGFSLIPVGSNGNTGASGFKMTPNGINPALIGGGAINIKAMIETTLGGLTFPNGTLQHPSGPRSPLFTVAHDETLQGDGTSASPLGIKVPLTLDGALTVGGLIQANPASGNAVEATGGNSQNLRGGLGVEAHGGQGFNGGAGVEAHGGQGANSGIGGNGVVAFGGNSATGLVGFGGGNDTGFAGGAGLLARGGHSTGFTGGKGAELIGGDSDTADGGAGLDVAGGDANGPGHQSGAGIVVRPGTPRNGASRGPAGQFAGDVNIDADLFVGGDVEIRGNLSKGGGSFKIDHPLDPANKYLYHSFVESPDMMNIYNGNVTTDANGDAFIELPQYFGALNRDFRYQLTVIGTFAQAIVAEKVNNNHFRIKTNSPNVEVSWQVTGIRQDAYANKNRILVEQDKAERERGFYLHPAAFDQPEEKSVLMVRHPELLRQMKEAREKAQKEERK